MVNKNQRFVNQMLRDEKTDSHYDRAWSVKDDDIVKSLLRQKLSARAVKEIEFLSENSKTFKYRIDDVKAMLKKEKLTDFKAYKAYAIADFENAQAAYQNAKERTGKSQFVQVTPLTSADDKSSFFGRRSKYAKLKMEVDEVITPAHRFISMEEAKIILDKVNKARASKVGTVKHDQGIPAHYLSKGKGYMAMADGKQPVFVKSSVEFDVKVTAPSYDLLSPNPGGQQSLNPAAYLSNKKNTSIKVESVKKGAVHLPKHT